MSDATKQALDAAIATHVADEYDGDMVAGWVLVTETSNLHMLEDGTGSMVVEDRDMQSSYLTQGLLHAALNVNTSMRGDDE